MGERRSVFVRPSRFSGRKNRGPITAIAAVALAALLAGCGDIRTDYDLARERAQAYVAARPGLPPEIAAAIRANTIRKGMTMEQVIAAWGRPAVVQQFRGGAVQKWFFGCDWPNYCDSADRMSPGPEETYNSSALFENGVVVDSRT